MSERIRIASSRVILFSERRLFILLSTLLFPVPPYRADWVSDAIPDLIDFISFWRAICEDCDWAGRRGVAFFSHTITPDFFASIGDTFPFGFPGTSTVVFLEPGIFDSSVGIAGCFFSTPLRTTLSRVLLARPRREDLLRAVIVLPRLTVRGTFGDLLRLKAFWASQGATFSAYFFAQIVASAVTGFHPDRIADTQRSWRPMKLFFSSWDNRERRASFISIPARSSVFIHCTSIPLFKASFCSWSARSWRTFTSMSFSIPDRAFPCTVNIPWFYCSWFSWRMGCPSW